MSGQHPHAGRIAAVAHLSAAHALADCAVEALAEDGIRSPARAINDARAELRRAADEIMEPCEIANVLQSVEGVIARTPPLPSGLARMPDGRTISLGGPRVATVTREGRAQIVRALIEAREAGKGGTSYPIDTDDRREDR